jgi:hypothetical protein
MCVEVEFQGGKGRNNQHFSRTFPNRKVENRLSLQKANNRISATSRVKATIVHERQAMLRVNQDAIVKFERNGDTIIVTCNFGCSEKAVAINGSSRLS